MNKLNLSTLILIIIVIVAAGYGFYKYKHMKPKIKKVYPELSSFQGQIQSDNWTCDKDGCYKIYLGVMGNKATISVDKGGIRKNYIVVTFDDGHPMIFYTQKTAQKKTYAIIDSMTFLSDFKKSHKIQVVIGKMFYQFTK